MRTERRLFGQVCAWDNVWAAYLDARRGKRRRADVAAFALGEEEHVGRLASELASSHWVPGGYRLQFLSVPKKRLVAAAPFRDRVVHHAVHRILAPVLMRRFVHESYACLPGKGTHRAVLRFQQGLRSHPWMARLDIRRYFLEIDWDILLGVVGRTVRDARLMSLLDRILASGSGLYHDPRVLETLGIAGTYQPAARKGLPIGNLTSQLFANVVLDGLDHVVKRELKVPSYLRYMDDMVLFGRSRLELQRWVGACEQWLWDRRRLCIHGDRATPVGTRQTFRFLGYAVSRTHRRVSARTLRRLAARARSATRSEAATDVLEASVASSLGAVLF